MKTPAALSLFN